MKNKAIIALLALTFFMALAAPATAATYYDANGKAGEVYLYYDRTGSDKWGDYAFADRYGGKYVPSVLWPDNTANVLPMDAKIYHSEDVNGQWVIDDNDCKIIAAIIITRLAYRDKLERLAQEARQRTQRQYSTNEEFNYEVPKSERPPGTEDWIWSKKAQRQQNNYSSPAAGGFAQRIGNFDYYFMNNGQSGFGQRIGDFYYFNGW